jgi:hypothetical protein
MEPQTNNTEMFQEEKYSVHMLEAKGTLVLALNALAEAEKEYRFVGQIAQGGDSNFSAFYTYFHKLYMLTREQVPQKLSGEVEKWLTSVEYSTSKAWIMFTSGVDLFIKYQTELFKIGIKDTNLSPSGEFPFEYYRDVVIKKDELVDKSINVEVVGFSNGDYYSSKVTNLFLRSLELHSMSKNNEARELFYNILGYFAILFDMDFIDNCIEINNKINSNTSLSVYHKNEQKYRLHLGEFSRLIMRAGVSPKPDIRIDYNVPWEVPKSLEELSFDGRDVNVSEHESMDIQ